MNQYLQIVYYKFKFCIYRTNERKKVTSFLQISPTKNEFGMNWK